MKNKNVFKIMFAFLFFVITVVVICGWSVIQLIRPGELSVEVNPDDLDWEHETIQLMTDDGLKLSGWFVPSVAKENKGAVIWLYLLVNI